MAAEREPIPEEPRGPRPDRQAQERTWGALCHLSALVGLIIPYIGAVLGPGLLWYFLRNDFEFVDDQGRESLNFQISMIIYSAVAYVLTFTIILAIITIPLLVAIAIFDVIQVIVAALRAHNGIRYRYPFTLRFIR